MKLTATYGRVRDTQKQRVYDSEGVLHRFRSKPGQRFLFDEARLIPQRGWLDRACSIEDVQRYVDHLVRQPWFQSRFGQRTIRVHWKAGGNATGSFTGGRIAMPPWSRTERVILHEVAHNLVMHCEGGMVAAPHGPEFAAVLLLLARHHLGADAAKALRTAFREHRVRVAPSRVLPSPGTHPVVTTAERRAKAAERAATVPAIARRATAASVIRSVVVDPHVRPPYFGEAASKPRRRAMDTARVLCASSRPIAYADHARIVAAADTLRQSITGGLFGPAGRKPRTYALAVARRLDEIARLRRPGGRQMVYAAKPERW